jgi:uroporphyrinogen decarboxylase
MSKKQSVLDAFRNKETESIPAGFWFHFSPASEFPNAPGNPKLFKRTVEGHKAYFSDVRFEILKIMTEGYFVVPTIGGFGIYDVDSLRNLEPADHHSPWFDEQVELARQLADAADEDAAVFYTLFSPIAYLSFGGMGRGIHINDDDFAGELIDADPQALKHALDVLAGDIAALGERILSESGADGIFFSVRNYEGVSKSDYEKIIAPGERAILRRIAKIKDDTILHVCSDTGIKNDFSYYVDYEAKAINWGVGKEGLSLAEGKELFGGKAVIGGFDNTPDGCLYRGDRASIERQAEKIIAETGRTGVIVGADCALPNDINYEHLKWLRQKLKSL